MMKRGGYWDIRILRYFLSKDIIYYCLNYSITQLPNIPIPQYLNISIPPIGDYLWKLQRIGKQKMKDC